MSLLQASSIRTGSIFSNLDVDGAGFVDNSVYYQLLRDGYPIDLTNRAGRTFSDNSSRVWNAT